MASAILVFHQAGNRSVERESMPVVRLTGARTEVLTSGAASVRSTLRGEGSGSAANTGDGGFVTVIAQGANLWVASGATPTAAKPTGTGAGYPVLDGQSVTFAIAANDRVAVIEWS